MKRNLVSSGARINRGTLDAKLGILKVALTSNVAVEQAGYLVMGGHYISAFDGEVGVNVHLPENLPSACVSAKPFTELVKKGGDSTVELELQENNLHFKCGRTKAALPTKELNAPLSPEEIEGLEWFPIPKDFIMGLTLCAESAATDISRGVLTCVMCERSALTGCDSYRLMRFELEEALPDEVESPLFIPASKVQAISKHEVVSFAVGHGMIHFSNAEKDYLSVSLLSGNYPSIKRVIDDAKGGEPITVPAPRLFDALMRIEPLASESSIGKEVELSFDGDILLCKVASDSGWASESVKGCENPTGEALKFRMHIHHLKTILGMGVSGSIVNSKGTLLFQEHRVSYVACKISD
jgi:DNA polymerase III sliding clamp (beta) subunit (PCNA family)